MHGHSQLRYLELQSARRNAVALHQQRARHLRELKRAGMRRDGAPSGRDHVDSIARPIQLRPRRDYDGPDAA